MDVFQYYMVLQKIFYFKTTLTRKHKYINIGVYYYIIYTYLSLVSPTVRGATEKADRARPCDDGGDVSRDGARGGVPACPGAVRRCRRARDGETTPVTRVVTQRYGDRSPSTTPSPVDTDLGRSGFPGVPSFSLFVFQKPTTITEVNDNY